MAFNTWEDFKNFETVVKNKYRFIHSPVVKEFLDNIRRTLPERVRPLALGTDLFRSQIGCNTYTSQGQVGACGFPPERMKPNQNFMQEGRANPKGILYMYLSNVEKTSLAELRPHKGQIISLARFKINRELKIVDCYSVQKHYSYWQCIFDEPRSQEDIGSAIWSMINISFTKPVTNNESSSEYVPTQILAELFKSDGFDGFCFKSGMGEGYNFLLFDVDAADFIDCKVMETKSISYEFSEFTDHYLLADK